MARLAIIGVGRIGGEVAYLAASLGIADELVLYDSAPDLLRAQVLDLEHTGLRYPSVRIHLISGTQMSAFFLQACHATLP